MKSKISDEMHADPEYWDHRPLTSDMVEYAAQDVVYLPKMYSIFQDLMTRSLMLKVFQKSSN
jgi:ribonuclease D